MTVVRAAWKLALVAILSVCAMGLSSCAPPPQLRVTTVVSGLGLPWDVTFAPDGRMFFTERAGRIRVRHPDGTVRQLQADLSDLWAVGEVGLMGIHVDPAFNQNRRLYTCQGHQSGDAHDIRIVPWVVSSDGQRLVRRPAIVTGIPATGGSHGGCRLRFGPDQSLWIGTGDATTGTNPQDLTSLGGKILRVNRFTGEGVDGQPVLVERERQHAAGAQLRPPERAGHRAARRRHDVDRRARHRQGRRDQPGHPRQLRLGSGARVQRGPADDRPRQVPERGRGGLVVGRADAGHVRRRLAHRLAVGHLGGPPRGGHAEGRVAAHLQGVAERHEAHAGGDPVQGPLRPAPRRPDGPRRRALPHDLQREPAGPDPAGRPA